MNQEKDNVGPTEPKMIIRRLHNQFTFNSNVFLSNLMGQLANHMLQLGANGKQKLQNEIIMTS